MSLDRKRSQQSVPMVDQIDPRMFHCEVGVLRRHGEVDHVGQSTRDLRTRSSSTDDNKIQCALPHQRRVAIGVLENGQYPRTQLLGFFYGVERKGVLLGTFDAEKVRL